MRLWSKQPNQSGDTIVEVLIAVAIISSVLAGAFLVAQKSAMAVRDSQEHGEVSQLLQGQIELVRSLAISQAPGGPIYSTSPKYFCMNGTNPAAPVRTDLGLLGTQLPDLNSDDFTKYDTCGNLQNLYYVAISFDPTTNVFTFVARWDRVGGGKNQEQMSYRAYPHTIAIIPPATCSPNNQIVLTLDNSNSLVENNLPSGKTRRQELVEVATNFVQTTVGGGNSAALVDFNGTAHVAMPMTANVPSLVAAINGLSPGSGTRFVPALNTSDLQWLPDPSQHRIMVFISDGKANENASAILPITDRMKAAGVEIYTIGISNDADVATLQPMASTNDYQQVIDDAQFEYFMSQISAQLRCN